MASGATSRADRTVQVRITGQRELERRLKALGNDAVKEMRKAHLESAQIVLAEAKPNIPVHGSVSVASGRPYWMRPNHSPGLLLQTARAGASIRSGVVRAGGAASSQYAGPIHYGWPSRPNPAKGWRGGPIKPNTFFYDALDRRRREVEDAFYRYIRRIIRQNGLG